MYDGFVNVVSNVSGSKVVVIDRYNVAELHKGPLDKLCITEMKHLKQELVTEEYAKLEGVMRILRKRHGRLVSCCDRERCIIKYSPVLKQAHKYALKLIRIFNIHKRSSQG